MARVQETDYLQGFRFHVRIADFAGDNAGELLGITLPGIGEAGFQSVTIPDMSIEPAEYREGIYKYTKKFPGPPTFSDVSLMRGIVSRDTRFFDWGIATQVGSQYRADVEILHYHRANFNNPNTAVENAGLPGLASRIYKCHECFPIRAKPTADFDATSGEVSMAELDFALEWFEIVDVQDTPAP